MKQKWFKSKPVSPGIEADQVDREAGIIRDVVMAQAGEAKGHGFSVEHSFIEELVSYDRRHFAKTGLKARFGHPAMSDTTMGKQMGIFRNFRLREDQAIADLHLLDAADLSPTAPNMREWMLAMAEERPDFVMSSIVFRVGKYYQYDDEGKKVFISSNSWGYPEKQWDDREVYATLKDHFYTDLVEAGAITDHLFSQQFNRDKFAVQAVEFVQDNPDLLAFLREHPEKLVEFATQLNINLPDMNFAAKLNALKDFFFGDGQAPGKEEVEAALDAEAIRRELRTEFETEHQQAIQQLTAQVEQLQSGLAETQSQLDAANNRIEALATENATLRERVPAEHTELDEQGPVAGEVLKLDPITQAAREAYLRRKARQSQKA